MKYDWSKETTYNGFLPALPDDMNESKTWQDGDYAERVRCLIIQNESLKTQLDHFLSQAETKELPVPVKEEHPNERDFNPNGLTMTEKGREVLLCKWDASTFSDLEGKYFWDLFGRPSSDNTAHEYGALIRKVG